MVPISEFQHLRASNQTKPRHFDDHHHQGPTAPWCVCLPDLDRSGRRRFRGPTVDLFEGIFLRILPYAINHCYTCYTVTFGRIYVLIFCSKHRTCKSKTTNKNNKNNNRNRFQFLFCGKIVEITTNVSMYVVDGRKT